MSEKLSLEERIKFKQQTEDMLNLIRPFKGRKNITDQEKEFLLNETERLKTNVV